VSPFLSHTQVLYKLCEAGVAAEVVDNGGGGGAAAVRQM